MEYFMGLIGERQVLGETDLRGFPGVRGDALTCSGHPYMFYNSFFDFYLKLFLKVTGAFSITLPFLSYWKQLVKLCAKFYSIIAQPFAHLDVWFVFGQDQRRFGKYWPRNVSHWDSSTYTKSDIGLIVESERSNTY